MSSWGCPHDLNGKCQRVPGRDCDIGMKGCILFGRFTFADETKNTWRRTKEERARDNSPQGANNAADRPPDRDPAT